MAASGGAGRSGEARGGEARGRDSDKYPAHAFSLAVKARRQERVVTKSTLPDLPSATPLTSGWILTE
jgi:hypothetical protein